MRQDAVERTLMISNMANPPQHGEYRELVGDLFPEDYPFDYARIFDYRYFWLKYYMSQRNVLAIAKKPTYVNYEILCNAFATRIIDMSKVELYKLKNTEMSREELEVFLEEENQYTITKFAERYHKIQRLEEIEKQLSEKRAVAENEKRVIQERQNKLHSELHKVKTHATATATETEN